jgi:hypothetical protein
MAEGVVLILLGLFVGSWIARRKRQSLGQPDLYCEREKPPENQRLFHRY